MLDMGFRDTIKSIFTKLPSDVQVGLFSATLKENTLNISKNFMRDPVTISVKEEELTLDGIRQYYCPIEKEEQKASYLQNILANMDVNLTIVYCNTKRKAELLADEMRKVNFNASSIHAEMSQEERTSVMAEFRKGATRILIATNLLARGIDIQQVSMVIN